MDNIIITCDSQNEVISGFTFIVAFSNVDGNFELRAD